MASRKKTKNDTVAYDVDVEFAKLSGVIVQLADRCANFYWHFLWAAGGMSVTSMVHGKVVMSGTQIVLE